MSRRQKSGYFGWPIVFGLAWLACALVALDLTQGEDGIAAVWPPSGIFVAALLLFGPRRRRITTLYVAAASMISNVWAGSGMLDSAGYTVANLAEGYLVFYLMGASKASLTPLSRPWTTLRFAAAAIVAGCFSGLMAGLLSGNMAYPFLFSWTSTVTLGMLVGTPVILFMAQDPQDRRDLLTMKSLWTMLVVAILSAAAFGQADMPLLFLPVLGIAVATAVMGLSGAAVAVLIIATIGSVLNAFNAGPLTLFFSTTEEQVLFFQIYLVALLGSSMPLAYLLSEREQALTRTAENATLLEAAERAAKVGHWRFQPGDNSARWSREALRICGFEESEHPGFEQWLALVHPDDRDRIRAFIVEAMSQALPFAFETRIVRAPGDIVHVDCRGQAEADGGGKVIALFGTMLDVTERAQTMAQLEIARAKAEREAAEVRMLAETDALTGMPNRRYILANLAEAMDANEFRHEPLTVAMVDIDHFKAINDEFGHEVGDTVLKQIAAILMDELRSDDSVGRMGGEEFLFVFPKRRAAELDLRCDRMRERLAAEEWEHPMTVTLSIGIAELQPGWDERDLLRAADEALYKAKRAGRNRHTVHAA